MDQTTQYAISLKQPWATLVVSGLKTIEVRKWPTARRGRVLIHAARISDPRPEPWGLVPAELKADAQLVGGLVGAVEVGGCKTYRDREAFAADQGRHLVPPNWFDGSVLYGFILTNPAVLPFRRFPGWVRFFPVPDETVAGDG